MDLRVRISRQPVSCPNYFKMIYIRNLSFSKLKISLKQVELFKISTNNVWEDADINGLHNTKNIANMSRNFKEVISASE